MKDFYTSKELLDYANSVAIVEKYKYYKDYVEPLEKDYEELYIECEKLSYELEELRQKDKHHRQVITRMKKQKNGAYNKNIFDEDDAIRYRNQCKALKEKNDKLEKNNSALREELNKYRNKSKIILNKR